MPPPATRRALDIEIEHFDTLRPFVIARGARTEATVVTVALGERGQVGRGECVPYGHYGESPGSVIAQIEGIRGQIEAGIGRHDLLELLPAGAARNGLDAALWDLEARLRGTSVGALAGLGPLEPVRTVRTISLGTPEAMAAEAADLGAFERLKLKLDAHRVAERLSAVRSAAPHARLIADANEAWPALEVETLLATAAAHGVELIEQPVPPADDAVLAAIEHTVPICADEAFHSAADFDRVTGRYDYVNLKLDKTGGLTHALEVRREAERRGLGVMVGCMLSTSLSIAPALLLAQGLSFVDLDGPYLLAEDRDPPLRLAADGRIEAEPGLWGG